MIDMSKFIAARSDQLNADDLIDGPRTVTITKVTAQPDAAEQPVSIHYDGGEGRPWKPCKTMRRILVSVWGKDASKYAGRSITLYRDPTVAFGGMQVGGIRVSHMSHIESEKTVALQVTRGRKAPFKIKPLVTERKQPTGDDAATKWANGYIAKLAEFTTVAAVQNFSAQKASKLAELETARPDLHEKVVAAFDARTAELRGAFEDGDLDGKPDDPLAAWLAKIADASDEKAVDALDKQSEFDRGFFSQEQNDELDEALATRRNAIRAEQAAAKEGVD